MSDLNDDFRHSIHNSFILVGLLEKREVSAPRCRGEEAGVTVSDLEQSLEWEMQASTQVVITTGRDNQKCQMWPWPFQGLWNGLDLFYFDMKAASETW